ncbi:hypothetical protein RSAG8_06994, partial [Rhizoctonia solani AG-8 WAC10335]
MSSNSQAGLVVAVALVSATIGYWAGVGSSLKGRAITLASNGPKSEPLCTIYPGCWPDANCRRISDRVGHWPWPSKSH